MGSPHRVERRDPCAPLLKLGVALAAARRDGASGVVEVVDRGVSRRVRVVHGLIADVSSSDGTYGDEPISRRAARLFQLPRPHILWTPERPEGDSRGAADPGSVVLHGVRSRADLFEPRDLVGRIPTETLQLRPESLEALRRLDLAPDERDLIEALRRPTPVSFALWKRGVEPRRAGALLVALNLLGAFGISWRPGVLPRVTAALRVLERARAGASDRGILGVAEGATKEEATRAFRKLSLDIHPDRLFGVGDDDAKIAAQAFHLACEAHARIQRAQPRVDESRGGSASIVAGSESADRTWGTLLGLAREASRRGDVSRCRAYALKSLAASPPAQVRGEILELLRNAAK